MKKVLATLAALALIACARGEDCKTVDPSLWAYNRLQGFVVQAMPLAVVGAQVDYQLTARNATPGANRWTKTQDWVASRGIHTGVPPFKRGRYSLWLRARSPHCCPSNDVKINL